MFIVYAIIIFALLILVHEIGHLVTAKAVHVNVEEFALGMGPRLASFERGGTIYSVRPFPIGGFCKMEGEDEDSDSPGAFNNRPIPARALVLLAGSLMNILLCILMFSVLIFIYSDHHTFITFFQSFGRGAAATWELTKMMYGVIVQLFTGHASMNDLTGPVGIVKAVSDSAKLGFAYVVQLAALISLNLGIVNLLPLPALDGGRILFLIIRIFTGKRISDSLEGKIHLVGILLLFGLMIYITFIDVGRFVVKG
jgi:regulator of sigma E protease